MKKMHRLFAAALFPMVVAGMVSAQTVTNVTALPRYPWNKLVDIDYEIVGEVNAQELDLIIEVIDDDPYRRTGYDPERKTYRAKSFNVDTLPVSEGKHRVTWDAGKDQMNFESTNVTFRVSLIQESSPYLVIDLSRACPSNQPAITTLHSVPAGGWTDEYKTQKLVLRRIPAGTFLMGSPTNELGREEEEIQHHVMLTRPFYMGVFEVTRGQWEKVVGGGSVGDEGEGGNLPKENVTYVDLRGEIYQGWPDYKSVEENSFIWRLRQYTQVNYLDLPTEAQWEYSCRAGTTTALNSGKDLTAGGSVECANLNEVARNYYNSLPEDDSTDVRKRCSAIVGSYLPNNWGLYDMHGNVCEWCLDWYNTDGNEGCYSEQPVTDPVGPRYGKQIPNFVASRIIRGGDYSMDSPGWFRSAAHDGMPFRGFVTYKGVGFRLCLALPEGVDGAALGISDGVENDGITDRVVSSATSPSTQVDFREGPYRFLPEAEVVLAFSEKWDGQGGSVQITAGGVDLFASPTLGEGHVSWSTPKLGDKELSREVELVHTSGEIATPVTVLVAKPVTLTSPVPVPFEWLDVFEGWLPKYEWNRHDHARDYGLYEEAAMYEVNRSFRGRKYYTWEYYLMGYKGSLFDASFYETLPLRISLEIVDGEPRFSWTPDCGAERSYRILGKASLSDPTWEEYVPSTDKGSQMRFFKVEVSMPE